MNAAFFLSFPFLLAFHIFGYMIIFLGEVLKKIKSGEIFSIRYVAHGDKKKRRPGGQFVEINKAVMTSYYNRNNSINIKDLDTGEIKECKTILILKFNGDSVYR